VRDNLTFSTAIFPTIPGRNRRSRVSDWYRSLPKGLDTRLKLRARSSAGQAQLLAFARISARSGLVILDEASSRLDPATERIIERTRQAAHNRTAIIVARWGLSNAPMRL
jgi:ABC-type multidrug transport system fused ATPase/permease subunit